MSPISYQRMPLRHATEPEREPLTLAEHHWQNHGQHLTADEVLTSWPVRECAELAADHGLDPAFGFADAANDLWQRMGDSRRITVEQARQIMQQSHRGTASSIRALLCMAGIHWNSAILLSSFFITRDRRGRAKDLLLPRSGFAAMRHVVFFQLA